MQVLNKEKENVYLIDFKKKYTVNSLFKVIWHQGTILRAINLHYIDVFQ